MLGLYISHFLQNATVAAQRQLTKHILQWKKLTWHSLGSPPYNPIAIQRVRIDDIKRATAPSEGVDITTKDYSESYPHSGVERGIFKYRRSGTVIQGEWDQGGVSIERLPEVEGVRMLLEDGTDIRDIPYFQRCADYIAAGHEVWGYKDIETFYHKRPKDLRQLAESIRSQGVVPQQELAGSAGILDEISVNIDRNGNPIFNTKGHHRLAIARLLNIETIPVLVVVRHSGCVDV